MRTNDTTTNASRATDRTDDHAAAGQNPRRCAPLRRTHPNPPVDLDRYAQWCRGTRNHAARTANEYRREAGYFLHWLAKTHPTLAVERVEAWHVEDYLTDLATHGHAGDTRRRAYHALAVFYDWVLRKHRDRANPVRQTTAPAAQPATTHPYTEPQLDALLTHARDAADAALARGHHRRWVGLRFDHAVLAVFRYSGLRLSELCNLRRSDVDLDRRELNVTGKGSYQRTIPIAPPCLSVLTDYLTHIRPHCPPSDYVFANPRGIATRNSYGRLSKDTAEDILPRHANPAGLPEPHHPHRLRHSYATHLLRRGASVEHLRRLLGHADIHTTLRYLHLNPDDLHHTITAIYTDHAA